NVFAFSGRVHYHEGYSMRQVVFPIRVMAEFDIKTVILTNAAGAINKSYNPGDIVAIEDHINLMGDNPLRGTRGFIDLTEAYYGKLRKTARETADNLGLVLHSGVYVALSGPAYETPAEINALRNLGADMVGMSTVPETIMANKLGMNVLGLSIITNMAAGMSGKSLSHQEVLETSKNTSQKVKDLIKATIEQLNR
ncbi:MAG: purine-nucleoside phosphorylase, partial [Planctomycetes bacterium]|nr:purine-nucleoside phosphorylase [Planctomycetota bacterium]